MCDTASFSFMFILSEYFIGLWMRIFVGKRFLFVILYVCCQGHTTSDYKTADKASRYIERGNTVINECCAGWAIDKRYGWYCKLKYYSILWGTNISASGKMWQETHIRRCLLLWFHLHICIYQKSNSSGMWWKFIIS